MRIDVLTLFPDMFRAVFGVSIYQRAMDNGLVQINLHNIRDYTHDRHHTVDDTPYGGGPGMVMKPEPIFEAVEAVKAQSEASSDVPVILLTPQGRLFDQKIAGELSQYPHLIIICGHYEGVDERVAEHMATDRLSIGDYVLTGGELPAMVVIDAVVRLVPGVLGSSESPVSESHMDGLLEYPQYTRPSDFRGWMVPDILLSGDHARIARWRQEQSLRRTLERRPDLINKAKLSPEDRKILAQLASSGAK
ncbi:MAG: tRNA (guanosine(37)-N1)-methyltransferase TrmD [Dehalococcoidales bacterium]|nr:tRNA (guanosine(37)-N1)-methyltransferase TrmD [Dehalococcoidales bacterium]